MYMTDTNCDDFIIKLKKQLDIFKTNMSQLSTIPSENSSEEWMRLFLTWSDWQTDMHNYVWNNKAYE